MMNALRYNLILKNCHQINIRRMSIMTKKNWYKQNMLLLSGGVILGSCFAMSLSKPVAAQSSSILESDSNQKINIRKPMKLPCNISMKKNHILGDRSVQPMERPHRIILAGWAVHRSEPFDPRISSLRKLFQYMKMAGYDGIELTLENFWAKYLTGKSKDEVIPILNSYIKEFNISIVGGLWHSFDWQWDDEKAYLKQLRSELQFNKAIGSQYATFQIWLSPKYMESSGEYREDEQYLNQCADRIEKLQQLCFEEEMNFYVETHVGRISEDPCAFVKIMERSRPFEINGDFSHYICRGMLNGSAIDKIRAKIGHTHQRMARIYGDLSCNVLNPNLDWNNAGVTYQAFTFLQPALKGGLSSRCIVGEAGPIHQVKDPLSQDRRMIPLFRAMASIANEEAKGQRISLITSPSDIKPFQLSRTSCGKECGS